MPIECVPPERIRASFGELTSKRFFSVYTTKPKTTAEVFGGKKVALFAVPGAYTPTCHKAHMPGFVDRAAELKSKGFDTIIVGTHSRQGMVHAVMGSVAEKIVRHAPCTVITVREQG